MACAAASVARRGARRLAPGGMSPAGGWSRVCGESDCLKVKVQSDCGSHPKVDSRRRKRCLLGISRARSGKVRSKCTLLEIPMQGEHSQAVTDEQERNSKGGSSQARS